MEATLWRILEIVCEAEEKRLQLFERQQVLKHSLGTFPDEGEVSPLTLAQAIQALRFGISVTGVRLYFNLYCLLSI